MATAAPAAGELDRRITIESRTPSQSTSGEVTNTWSTFATVWAKRIPKGGRKYLAAQQINAEIDEMFETRYLAGLTLLMRVNFESKLYDIISLDEIGRREGWTITCKVHRA